MRYIPSTQWNKNNVIILLIETAKVAESEEISKSRLNCKIIHTKLKFKKKHEIIRHVV